MSAADWAERALPKRRACVSSAGSSMAAPGRFTFIFCDIGLAALAPGQRRARHCAQRATLATKKSNCSLCYIVCVDIRVPTFIFQCSLGYKLAQVLYGDERTDNVRTHT